MRMTSKQLKDQAAPSSSSAVGDLEPARKAAAELQQLQEAVAGATDVSGIGQQLRTQRFLLSAASDPSLV